MSHRHYIGRLSVLAALCICDICFAPALAGADEQLAKPPGHWVGTYSITNEKHETTSSQVYTENGSATLTLTGKLAPTWLTGRPEEDPEINLYPAVTANSFALEELTVDGCEKFESKATQINPEYEASFNINVQRAEKGLPQTYTLSWPSISLLGTFTVRNFKECQGFEEHTGTMNFNEIPYQMAPQPLGPDPTHLVGSVGGSFEGEHWEESWNLQLIESPDTDGDGLSNYLEKVEYGTDPEKYDTDGDGYSDGEEVAAGTNPLDPNSHPEPPKETEPGKGKGPGEEGWNGHEGAEGPGAPGAGNGGGPPPPPAQSPIYMALGDSFSSGEGACPSLGQCSSDYIAGTNVIGVNECHRSKYSYPQIASLRETLDPPYYDSACSGAEIKNLYGPQWDEEPQLEGLTRAEAEPGTYVRNVSIGIGGNDADFSDALFACVISHYIGDHKMLAASMLASVSLPIEAFGDYKAGQEPSHCKGHVSLPSFANIGKELTAVYERIAEISPFATIYVMGYPKLFAQHPHQTHSVLHPLGTCNVNSSDAEWLNEETVRFDKTIQEAVKRAHVKAIFVDQVDAFRNHELCRKSTNDPYIQGLHVSLFNGRGYHAESFHPNNEGQRQFAADLDACVAVEAAALTSGYCKSKHP